MVNSSPVAMISCVGATSDDARQPGHPLAETGVDVALRVFRQQHAVHIHGAADHDRAGQDVLTDRRVQEAVRAR